MKYKLFFFVILFAQIVIGQTFSTNLTPVGWEHNVLFNATTRYSVSQQGPAVDLPTLFDGGMSPLVISGLTPQVPTVILIEGLSGMHTQAGAWVGWTTRYLPAARFKIEGYDSYDGANVWRVIADYSDIDYGHYNFTTKIPVGGSYTKLKFTFYSGQIYNGANSVICLSELFFIHPEATYPYAGLLSHEATNWKYSSSNMVYNLGNVGIGIDSPQNKLDVKGTVHAQEVKVDMNGWPDFVFKKEYNLPTLNDVEKHIAAKGHLENIPSEEEVLKNGISLGDMNAKFLQKIEELTLYVIELNKKVTTLQDDNIKINKENRVMIEKIESIQKMK